MENISRIKEKCMGCKSCEQSCPKHCISMVENKEGFWYPSVDEKSCIECKMCLKKCPVENTEFHRNEPHKVWAWRNKNDVDIMRSASGGAADSAAKTILQMGGVVYGAAYDEQLAVSHIEVTDEAEREKLQSSKYVQSDPKDSYTKVKQRLSEGKTVLFTGTPCQIAGLYALLGGNPENLYTLSLDRYGKHFMDGDCYRESCYQCAYANTSRVGDLTVGDFWGIAKSHPSFNSPKGVSSVFVNTEKGQKLFEMMRVLAEVEEATLEEGMVKQHNLVQPSNRPVTRDTFYKSIDEPGFIGNIKVGFQPKARLKSVLPNKLIQKIKSL